jgi:hypothetical protein
MNNIEGIRAFAHALDPVNLASAPLLLSGI